MQASRGRIQQRAGDNKRIDLRASGETSVGQEFIPTRLSSGARSGFPSCFHAALLLGHPPRHEENQIPVFLIHLGKQGQQFPHQQCPGSRRFQRILRAGFCRLRRSGRSELHPDLIILDLNLPDRNHIAPSEARGFKEIFAGDYYQMTEQKWDVENRIELFFYDRTEQGSVKL
jgi:hypothetical protein